MPPLVSVVTPVYNGAQFFAECIESVLRQKYGPFEFVIVDNASTDDTPKIVSKYASQSDRIRYIRCEEKLPLLQNWNRALQFISDQSKYVWVLPADDAMMGEALALMMDVACRSPKVGIVASLRQRGHVIQNGGLPEDHNIFKGKEIGRRFLRQDVFPFSPTGSIIRRDLIDANRPFYFEQLMHGDLAAIFNVLDGVDFGFVHEVLMFSREHANTVTASQADRRGTQIHDGLFILEKFGPRYLGPAELAVVKAAHLRWYYRFLLRGKIMMREPEFFDFHMAALRRAGHVPTSRDLAIAALGEVKRAILHPRLVLKHIRARLRLHAGSGPIWDQRSQMHLLHPAQGYRRPR